MTGKKSSNSANNQDQLYKIATTRYLSHSYKFKLNCFTGNGKFTYVYTFILLLNCPTIVKILSQNCCVFCPEKNCQLCSEYLWNYDGGDQSKIIK